MLHMQEGGKPQSSIIKIIMIIIIIILTDKTVPLNGPDTTFMNKKTKNTFLIAIAFPNTHNLTKTIADKQKNTKNWRMKYVLCGSKKQYK
jgi:hypothetical protein